MYGRKARPQAEMADQWEVRVTVEALRRGSPEVLADLLAGYGRELHAVAFLIVRDRAAAEDIVADSLLTALDRGATLRDEGALRPWLLRIATNKALRHRQRAGRIVELDVVDPVARSAAGPDVDDRLALWQAVIALPPRMRAAVGLRYYLDLPVETVATVLDVSPNTVKTQLKSALAALRVALAEESVALAEVRHA
jgi:RNA polymerase sigma factor (sigma-70 family)